MVKKISFPLSLSFLIFFCSFIVLNETIKAQENELDCCQGATLETEINPYNGEKEETCFIKYKGKMLKHGRQITYTPSGEIKQKRYYYLGKFLTADHLISFCEVFLQGLPSPLSLHGAEPLTLSMGFTGAQYFKDESAFNFVLPRNFSQQNNQYKSPSPKQERGNKTSDHSQNTEHQKGLCDVVFDEQGNVVKFSPNEKERVNQQESDNYIKTSIEKYHPEVLKNNEFDKLTIMDKRNLACSLKMEKKKPLFDLTFGSYKNGMYSDMKSYVDGESKGRGSSSVASASSHAPTPFAPTPLKNSPSKDSFCSGKEEMQEKKHYPSIFPDKIQCKKKNPEISAIYTVKLKEIKNQFEDLKKRWPCRKTFLENDESMEMAKINFTFMKYCFLENMNPSLSAGLNAIAIKNYDDLKAKVDSLWNSDHEKELHKIYPSFKMFIKEFNNLKNVIKRKDPERELFNQQLKEEKKKNSPPPLPPE